MGVAVEASILEADAISITLWSYTTYSNKNEVNISIEYSLKTTPQDRSFLRNCSVEFYLLFEPPKKYFSIFRFLIEKCNLESNKPTYYLLYYRNYILYVILLRRRNLNKCPLIQQMNQD